MLTSVPPTAASLCQVPLAPDDGPPRATAGVRRAASAAAPEVRRTGAAPTPTASIASRAAVTRTASRTASAGKARTSGTGYARSTVSSRSSASASAKKPGPLAFLDDPKLSVEEKLLKLLGYLNDKWNKELDQKMKEFKQTSTTTKTSSGSSSSSSGGLGGFLKKAVSFASAAIPGVGLQLEALRSPAVLGAVKAVAGPALAALATSAGQPELVPVALKYGGDVVDLLASAASAAAPAPAASGGSASPRTTTTTKETADGLGSDRDAQLKLMEMQRVLDQQKEMFSLVSNMLRTTHETRMAVVQNVR